MLKRDFIEKPYDIMNDILFYLYNNEGLGLKIDLVKAFTISMNTLNEYIMLLKEFLKENQLHSAIDVAIDGDKIKLTKSNNFSVNQCNLLFVKKSVKYQMIKELYEQTQIDSELFQKENSISPATYYRRISELNALLGKFDLVIKRNRIIGEEKQIRYFFFVFFWSIEENKDELYKRTKQRYDSFFDIMQKKLKIEFDDSSILQMKMWLEISEKRLNWRKQFVFNNNYEILERPLLGQVSDVFEIAFSNSEDRKSPKEILMFYDFFVSMKNFPAISSLAVRLAEAHRQDKTTLNYINETVQHYLSEKKYISVNISEARLNFIESLLFQIHAKNYYFKGFLLSTDSWGIEGLLNRLRTSFTKKDVTDLMEFCELIFSELSFHNEFNNLLAEINYTTVFNQLSEVNQQQVTIAVYHSQNIYLQSLTIQLIRAALGTKYSCEVIAYQANNNYDILLTNTEININQSIINYIYTYSDCSNKYDINQIEKIIQSFYALKKYLR